MNKEDKIQAFKEYLSGRNIKHVSSQQSYVTHLNNKVTDYIHKAINPDLDIWDIDKAAQMQEILAKLRNRDDWNTANRGNWVLTPINHYIRFLKSLSGNESADRAEATPQEYPPRVVKPIRLETKIVESIQSTGLIYDDLLIKRYVAALLTKPFVILSGLSGSGKTQLALAVAHALCEDIDRQLCFVAVGADWTNREPLLGYPNALKANDYVRPENGALDIIIRASDDPERPYFLVLDEMNLSYVERYFADFLSAMESHTDIALWTQEDGDVPRSVKLPSNLFIIGTINVDETTYMFSPKVLDRASVIEFKIQPSEMDFYLKNSKPVDINKANGAASSMAKEFLSQASNKDLKKDASTIDTLMRFFTELKSVNAEFGYRSASEIFRYLYNADCLGMSPNEAIDSAIVQKLLPKVHGSKKHVGPVLSKLWNLCLAQAESEPLKETTDVAAANLRYPLAGDKIARMYRAACNNGFTSFAEA